MNLYLTPAAIGYLTQFVLTLVIAAYLVYHAARLGWRGENRVYHFLLAGFFASVVLVVLLFFLDAALPPTQRLYAVYLENPAVGLFLTLLTQFAYHFPRLYPRRKWEARVVLVFDLLYTFWETGFAVYRGRLLIHSHTVIYRSLDLDRALLICLLLAPLAFVRQTIAASQDERAVPGFFYRSGLGHLWRPQGERARATRAFALVFLIPVALGLINLGRAIYAIPPAFFHVSTSVGILLTQFMFALVYLNAIPAITSFQLRLVGSMLVTVLAVFGAAGWAMTPPHAAVYRPRLADRQTLRFTPNAVGGYDVTPVPFHFDTELGSAVALQLLSPDEEPWEGVAEFAFTFPFYGKTVHKLWVLQSGAVSMETPLDYPGMEYQYAATPAIFPLFVPLKVETAEAGVFARQAADRLTITWYNLSAVYNPQAIFTFQLVLYRDGVFEITTNGLPDLAYQPDASPFANVWVMGALPGRPEPPALVNLADSPLHGGPQGLIQDHYLEFRRHVHELLAPLAFLILISSLAVVAGLPLFFHVNLIRPLQSLIEGVKRVEQGDLDIVMPVQYQDEIGFLTDVFNNMVRQLRELVTGLELQVAIRTRELERQQDDLRRAKDVAEAASRAKSAFLAHMSHELRTPLNAILGFSELMASDAQLTPEQKKNISIINRSGEHLLQLINDILVMAKIEAGQMTVQEKAFDLFGLLESLEELFSRRAADKGLVAIFEHSGAVPQYVIADEGKLRQILINLLGNAIKFTEEGEIRLTVSNLAASADRAAAGEPDPADHAAHLRAAASLVWLRITVQDTGIGIAPTELETVFEPFVQAGAAVERGGGTGLGLTISRQYARLMGGVLTAVSPGVPGLGSCFTLDVPVRLASAQEVSHAGKMAALLDVRLAPGQLAPDGTPYRLLVVDDAAENRELLVKWLVQLGFEVRTAENGLAALEVWQTWRPHLIWMDMRMPVLDGYEATRRLKALPAGRTTPVIALSASAFAEARTYILASGCDDLVVKPFRLREIVTMLTRHLGVQFVQRGEAKPVVRARSPSLNLAALPADWLAALHQAAIAADGDQIRILTRQIRSQHPDLAAALLEIVDIFDYDAILAALPGAPLTTDEEREP